MLKRNRKRVNMSMKSCMNRNLANIKMKVGNEGENIKRLQKMLFDLVEYYPSIPKIEIDGIYGENTKRAVKRFQELMGIYDTGVVDINTWNKLQLIYSKKNALEINSRNSNERDEKDIEEQKNVVKEGSQGKYVVELQEYINKVANFFPSIPKVTIDGIFGPKTKSALITFQRMFNLESDGIAGEITWATLYNASLGKIMPSN